MKNVILKTNILLFIALFFICDTASALTKSRSEARYKACLSNQRVIKDAIEMFNMDHPESLVKYDEETEQLLINEHYLKSKMQKSELKCNYKMFTNGEIYCEYHGGIDPEKIKPCPEFAEELEGILRYSRKEIINGILEFLIILGIFLWIIKFFKDLFSSSKKTSGKDEENVSNSLQDSANETKND